MITKHMILNLIREKGYQYESETSGQDEIIFVREVSDKANGTAFRINRAGFVTDFYQWESEYQ
jgi:hypothetical protein